MRFKRSITVLFLDGADSKKIEYDKSKKLVIILSPSLYWVQKLTLKVKYVRDVVKLLPSIFEDILPEGNYSYSAYKKEDNFLVFAYEDTQLIALLHDKGISLTDIQSIHFAQSEFHNEEEVLQINETQSLYIKDEIVLLAPTSWFTETRSLHLEGMSISKHLIKLQQYGHIVKTSSLYKISALLFALILLIFIESFITSQKITIINEQKEKLFSKYKLQSTMFQNRSLQSKYKNIYKKQSKLRQNIAYILNIKLQKNQKLEQIDYKNSRLTFSVSGVKRADIKSLTRVLQKKKLLFETSLHNDTLKVEIKL